MRTTHQQLHLPRHNSRWWVTHTASAVAAAMVVLYVAAVLLVMAGLYVLENDDPDGPPKRPAGIRWLG